MSARVKGDAATRHRIVNEYHSLRLAPGSVPGQRVQDLFPPRPSLAVAINPGFYSASDIVAIAERLDSLGDRRRRIGRALDQGAKGEPGIHEPDRVRTNQSGFDRLRGRLGGFRL